MDLVVLKESGARHVFFSDDDSDEESSMPILSPLASPRGAVSMPDLSPAVPGTLRQVPGSAPAPLVLESEEGSSVAGPSPPPPVRRRPNTGPAHAPRPGTSRQASESEDSAPISSRVTPGGDSSEETVLAESGDGSSVAGPSPPPPVRRRPNTGPAHAPRPGTSRQASGSEDSAPQSSRVTPGGDSSEETILAESSESEDIPVPEKKRAPKGQANPDKWKKNRVKIAREQGLPYTNAKGDDVEGNVMGLACRACDKPRDCKKMTELKRAEINNRFWKVLKTKKARKLLIQAWTHNKRGRRANSRNSYEWTMKTRDGRVYRVCRKMVASTTGIPEKTLSNWVREGLKENVPKATYKAPKSGKTRPISRVEWNFVEAFVRRLNKVPSHYCRKVYRDWKFLEARFTIAEIYRVYERQARGAGERVISHTTFRRKLKAMKVGVHKPRKDLCEVCEMGKKGRKTQAQMEAHIAAKNRAQQKRDSDERKAATSLRTLQVWTMDAQAQKLCPKSEASPMYFAKKLVMNNMTYFRKITKEGRCYIWPEHEGGEDTYVFSSIHRLHLWSILRDPANRLVEKVIIWSDSCSRQNRSSVVSSYFLSVAIGTGRIIEQKWGIPGHTWMPVDAMHSCIERNMRKKTINTPKDFVELCQTARKLPKKPYVVRVLNQTHFVKPVQDYVKSVRPGKAVGDPTVLELRGLRYKPDGTIFYKLDFNQKWKKLDQQVTLARGGTNHKFMLYYEKNDKRLKLTHSKYTSLQGLVRYLGEDVSEEDDPRILQRHEEIAQYYRNLPHLAPGEKKVKRRPVQAEDPCCT